MRKVYLLVLCFAFVISLAGCAGVKTYTYQEKRVDQDLSRGNRGVIMGKVPAEEPKRKPGRTMIGVDVTLPASKEYKARKKTLRETPPIEEKIEAPIVTLTVPPMPPGAPAQLEEEEAEEEYIMKETTYKVQEGDTLQKISRKFYGTMKKWPGIYEANKNVLKHPSRIYPGQVITIPALKEVEEPAYK